MAADALSDVLRTVRLTGATFFDVVARSPWVAESPSGATILKRILPGADRLIAYHAVTEGRCFAYIIGQEPITLEAGEVIVFPKGDAHILTSHPGMRADPSAPAPFDASSPNRLPFAIAHGQNGPVSAKLVCGYLACDAQLFNPVLDNLPPVIKSGDPKGANSRWLSDFIRLAVSESADKRAGGESVLAKLSELMFIEVVRRHLETLPPEHAGWFSGLRDPLVGKTLSLMHGEPARDWTIEELAKAAGASRSVLAERFAHLVGMPPMLYLAKWRMQIASRASEQQQRQYCDRRRRDRLRIGSRFQPRVQEDGRRIPLGLAARGQRQARRHGCGPLVLSAKSIAAGGRQPGGMVS